MAGDPQMVEQMLAANRGWPWPDNRPFFDGRNPIAYTIGDPYVPALMPDLFPKIATPMPPIVLDIPGTLPNEPLLAETTVDIAAILSAIDALARMTPLAAEQTLMRMRDMANRLRGSFP